MDSENNSVFNKEEQEDINKSRKIKRMIIDDMTNDGMDVPSKPGDIRVLKEVLESLDKETTDKALIRAKHKEVGNADTYNKMALAMISANRQAIRNPVARKVELDDSHIPLDTVDGEMSGIDAALELKDVGLGE